MRRALSLGLSLLLGLPAFAYDDYGYSNNDYRPSGFSTNQFDSAWNSGALRIASFTQPAFTFKPAPIQIPRINLDFSFNNTFSFSKLDFGRPSFDSYSATRFASQPVVNFNANYFSPSSVGNFSPSFSINSPQALKFIGPQTFQTGNLGSPMVQRTSLSSDFSSKMLTKAPALSPTSTNVIPANRSLNLLQNPVSRLFGIGDVSRQQSLGLRLDGTQNVRQTFRFSVADVVSKVIKAVPAFFAAAGTKIKDMAVGAWNRVVLGQKTHNTLTLPNGTTLDGKITVNRKNEIVAIAPGTLQTIGKFEQSKQGEQSLIPAKVPVKINDQEYLLGKFKFDGASFNLTGPGIKITKEAGATLEAKTPFKAYVYGDGEGNETDLGYGAMSSEDGVTETTSGLSFRNTNGFWHLDPNQSTKLMVGGRVISIAIDDKGRLGQLAKAEILETKIPQLLAGILPNPETSGFQLTGLAKAGPESPVRLGIPGIRPSQYTSGQLNAWRQETAAWVGPESNPSRIVTRAQMHQEGDQYVFTQGNVAFTAITGPDMQEGQPAKGQSVLYHEAAFTEGSRLHVTGPTDFPSYKTKVIVGEVAFRTGGSLDTEIGTLFQNDERGLRFSASVAGKDTSLFVKSLDLDNGTFVAILPDISQKNGEYIQSGGIEVQGRINFEAGKAELIPQSVKVPLLNPREKPGFFETGPEITGTAYVTVDGGKVSARTDRLVNLDDWKRPDEWRSVLTRTVGERYDMALQGFLDPSNSFAQRGAYLSFAVAILPSRLAEDVVSFTLDAPNAFRNVLHHGYLVYHEPHYGDKGLETLKAIQSASDFYLRAEPGAAIGIRGARIVAAEGSALLVRAANAMKSEGPAVLKPAMGEAGHFTLGRSEALPIAKAEVGTARPLTSPSYEVAFEVQLAKGKDFPGMSRGAHFAEGNKQLHAKMQNDPQFARMMEETYPGITKAIKPGPRGGFRQEPPLRSLTWHHHPTREGVIQLIPRNQHRSPGAVQKSLHPGCVGGMDNWGGC